MRERSHERKLQADSVKKRLNDKLKAIEDKEMAKINAETIEHQNKIKEKLSLPEEKTTYAEMQAEETKRRAKDDLVRKKIAQKKKERQETERAQAILVDGRSTVPLPSSGRPGDPGRPSVHYRSTVGRRSAEKRKTACNLSS